MTVLGRTGVVARTIQLPGESLLGVMDDRSLLTIQMEARPSPDRNGPGRRLQWATVLHRDAQGQFVDTLTGFPVLETFPVELGEGRMVLSADLFGGRTLYREAHETVAVSPEGTSEVQLFDGRGGLRGILRWPAESRQVEDKHVEAYIAERTAEGDDPEGLRRRVHNQPVAHSFPALSDLFVGEDGSVWIKEYDVPGGRQRPWRVFSPEGRLRASVVLPDRFSLEQIDSRLVVGVRRDEFDVEHVEVYELDVQSIVRNRLGHGAPSR